MTTVTSPSSSPSRLRSAARPSVLAALAVWIVAGVGVASTLSPASPRPLVPGLIVGTTALGVVAYRRWAALRALVDAVDVRWLLGYQALVRVGFGAAFLHRLAEGRIHPDFARVAGPGDLLAGGLAAALAVAWSLHAGRAVRVATLAWSALGLVDMLAVVVTAQRIVLFGEGPAALGILEMPYALLPTLVVPTILLSHAAIARAVFTRQ